jgi:hypothetical protein
MKLMTRPIRMFGSGRSRGAGNACPSDRGEHRAPDPGEDTAVEDR